MQTFLIYVLLSAGCVSVVWLVYKALLENRMPVKTIRYYFLIGMVVSMLAPVSPLVIRPSVAETESATPVVENIPIANTTSIKTDNTRTQTTPAIDWKKSISWVFYIYLTVMIFFIIGIIKELIVILTCYKKATKEKWGGLRLAWNDRFKESFSFFRLVFMNKESLSEGQDNILLHEQVHAAQYHSIDRLLAQLLTAFQWFNPFMYVMRNEIQLVHEYLADEGVLNRGVNKVRYQQLLLDHIIESKRIAITSTFKHSLIKKRFLMMSTKKAAPATRYRLLLLAPVTALLLLGVAFVNGQTVSETPKVVTAVALTKANVVYIGIENPVNISVAGYKANEIAVAIDNGTITGENGEYVIKAAKPGKAVITVKAGGKVVKETTFNAKYLAPPVASLTPPAGGLLIKGGRISKEALLKAGGIICTVENADIDIPFKVVSFTMSVITNDHVQGLTVTTANDRFSPEQIKLIQSMTKDQRIIIDDIAAAGPDGRVMKMPASMVFTIL
ncbi:MAG: M56 family metallopeptidase [Niastella sp.]|uniref:M56 family metallopeptidase n=1 Tax=Niastella sp. TaxID=1869183 RepID=UPI00389B1D04